jgi:hypothetical protein
MYTVKYHISHNVTIYLLDVHHNIYFFLDGPESVTLSPPTTTYTVTEGDTIPSISCTTSCRPQCTFMWTGPNGTTNDLYLHNINKNQKGTFYCTDTNDVGSKMSSNVEVDVRCKLLCDQEISILTNHKSCISPMNIISQLSTRLYDNRDDAHFVIISFHTLIVMYQPLPGMEFVFHNSYVAPDLAVYI